MDATKQGAGFWTSATPDGFSHSVQFLASGSTPGLLQPGESVKVPVYYAGWEHDQWDWSRPAINFTVGVLDSTNTQPVDWNSLKDSLRPASLSPTAWNAIYPNLMAQLGSTWGDYVRKLAADAQYLNLHIGAAIIDPGPGVILHGITALRAIDISQLFSFKS